MAGMNFQCQIYPVCTQRRFFTPSESQPPLAATGMGEGERLMVEKRPGMCLLYTGVWVWDLGWDVRAEPLA